MRVEALMPQLWFPSTNNPVPLAAPAALVPAGIDYEGRPGSGPAGGQDFVDRDDLVNAGAIWEDAAVVIDRHFVSSRKPDDLPDFCRGILQVMALASGRT